MTNPTNSGSSEIGDNVAPEETLLRATKKRGGVFVRQVANFGSALSWILNPGLWLGGFIWVYRDGRARRIIELAQNLLTPGDSSSLRQVIDTYGVDPSVWFVVGAALFAGFTLANMFFGLFMGGRQFRSMRMWLLFTAIVGGWLGLLVAWPEVYWHGQQRRVTPVLAAVESLARNLDANWPHKDGDMQGVGPFLAYPKSNPITLLPLQFIAFPNTTLRFSAVERSNDGTIRFELSGEETGAWLEWRADDQAPTPFVGGLETSYNVTRQQRLAPRWFLVRYRANAGGVR